MELLLALFTSEASLTFVDRLPLAKEIKNLQIVCWFVVSFLAMVWALKIVAWFLWQTMQENGGSNIAMASRFR